jgi:hypothetical protein
LTVKLEGPASLPAPGSVAPDDDPHPDAASTAIAAVENTTLSFMTRPSFRGRPHGRARRFLRDSVNRERL